MPVLVKRVVAGLDIDPELPGYKHVLVQPQPGGGLGCVKASIDSMYGLVASEWQVTDEGQFVLNVTVPANTTGCESSWSKPGFCQVTPSVMMNSSPTRYAQALVESNSYPLSFTNSANCPRVTSVWPMKKAREIRTVCCGPACS